MPEHRRAGRRNTCAGPIASHSSHSPLARGPRGGGGRTARVILPYVLSASNGSDEGLQPPDQGMGWTWGRLQICSHPSVLRAFSVTWPLAQTLPVSGRSIWSRAGESRWLPDYISSVWERPPRRPPVNAGRTDRPRPGHRARKTCRRGREFIQGSTQSG